MDAVQPPSKPCHNCRRQRLRCDRSYPHCNKCAAAGKECLGYGQLFRWTGAVASRGKLAGRTSSAPVVAASPSTQSDTDSIGTRSSESASRSSSGLGSSRSSTHEPADGSHMQLIHRTQPARVQLSAPWVLVDPLYQDLGNSHRYYLSYFTTRLCKDLVSQDVPECNPFRGLLALTKTHPVLQYIIVAASAAHMSNLVKATLPPANGNRMISYGGDDVSRNALKDALVAKHKALYLMRGALQDIETTGGDIVLAAALFFVNVELIESGKHGWRAHLDGAGKIMSLLRPTEGSDSVLRNYLLSDCVVYFILASAFMPVAYATNSYFQPSQIPEILGRAAANCYLCCPPDVLGILHSASQLSYTQDGGVFSDQVKEAGAALLQRAQDLDIDTWARDDRNVPSLNSVPVNSRVHAGSAHRLAACLYILQAIPPVGEFVGSDLVESLSSEIFEHLSNVPDDDPNFKATTWPTFIAGAGATCPTRQTWVMNRLHRLVAYCPWGFIYTAMDTLEIIWGLGEEERRSRSWVQILKDPDMNFLIV